MGPGGPVGRPRPGGESSNDELNLEGAAPGKPSAGRAEMNETLQFVLKHGYLVLFAWVFAEQIGLPLPSVPLLLAAGALAGAGRLKVTAVVGLPVVAALISDLLWYELGRRRGVPVLQFLCRVSLEPDSCVRRTESTFERQGARSLVLAKMNETLQFLQKHGYLVLFAWVFAEQIGLPLPSVPLLQTDLLGKHPGEQHQV